MHDTWLQKEVGILRDTAGPLHPSFLLISSGELGTSLRWPRRLEIPGCHGSMAHGRGLQLCGMIFFAAMEASA